MFSVEKIPASQEQEMDDKLKEYLVEELGRSFLTIPFDVWYYICKKTREKISSRFPHIDLQPMTEEDARLWYTRYCFHCDDHCLDFLKSVVTGYPTFKWSEEVEQLIKLRCISQEMTHQRLKHEPDYSPEMKRKKYSHKSGNERYDPEDISSSSDFSDNENEEVFEMPVKKKVSPDVDLWVNPEPPNLGRTNSCNGKSSKGTNGPGIVKSRLGGSSNEPAIESTSPEKLQFRSKKLDSILVTIPNVSPASSGVKDSDKLASPIRNSDESPVPVNREPGLPISGHKNLESPTIISAAKNLDSPIFVVQNSLENSPVPNNVAQGIKIPLPNSQFLDLSQPPPGFVPPQQSTTTSSSQLQVNIPDLNAALNLVAKLFPKEPPVTSPTSKSATPSPALPSTPILNKLIQCPGANSSPSNISIGSSTSRDEMMEQIPWSTPRLVLELPKEEIEARRGRHSKGPPRDFSNFTVMIDRDEDQADPRISPETNFHLQRCLNIKREMAAKTLIDFERRASVETDRMEEVSAPMSTEGKGKPESECFAKNYVDVQVDPNVVEEESSSEGDEMDLENFESHFVRRRKEEPEAPLITVSNSIFEETIDTEQGASFSAGGIFQGEAGNVMGGRPENTPVFPEITNFSPRNEGNQIRIPPPPESSCSVATVKLSEDFGKVPRYRIPRVGSLANNANSTIPPMPAPVLPLPLPSHPNTFSWRCELGPPPPFQPMMNNNNNFRPRAPYCPSPRATPDQIPGPNFPNFNHPTPIRIRRPQ